jgi:hypothetical protein
MPVKWKNVNANPLSQFSARGPTDDDEEQNGEQWAPAPQAAPPVVIPAKAPTPAAPAFVPPVAESKPSGVAAPAAPAFVGQSTGDAQAAEKKRLEAVMPGATAPSVAPKQEEQAVTTPTVEVFRGSESEPPPTETEMKAGVEKPPAPVAAPVENWGTPQSWLAETKLQDFTHVGGPKPSNFVSFGELASTLDDAWRKGLETDAQTAAKAREDARKAFSLALQQANERGADVESTPAYADFLRAQDYAESLIGGGLSSMPKGERSLGEEALASVYQQQLDPLAKAVREQREAAGKTASERNAQRVKAKESQEKLPVNEPYKAPPPPARASAQVDTGGAESAWESQELDADAQSFVETFAMAHGREPTSQELAARRAEMKTNLRSGKQAEAEINRAMPGKWA